MPFELLLDVLVEPELDPEDCVEVAAGVELVVGELLEFDPHAAAVRAARTSASAAKARMERVLIFRCIISPVYLIEVKRLRLTR
jgi:hypothetical protein